MKRWDAIASRLDHRKKLKGVEVGVWKGQCSAALLARMPRLRLYMVDRWSAYSDEERKRDQISQQARRVQREFAAAENQARRAVQQFGRRAEVVKASSADASQRFANGSLDFAFLDGDHSYEGLRDDIERWLPKIKPGGLLCGHDYTPDGKRPGITRAVHEVFGEEIETDIDSTWFWRVPCE